MNRKEIDAIIKNYKPHPGFFDLSNRPKCLTKKEYAQILYLQNFLAEENTRKEYYLKPYNRHLWDEISNLAAELQLKIFQYWGDEIFEVEGIKRKVSEVSCM